MAIRHWEVVDTSKPNGSLLHPKAAWSVYDKKRKVK